MELIKCGTKVTTVIGEISGIITAICVRFDKVQYEFSYFVNGEYKNIWIDSCEFIVSGNYNVVKIGYK